jgi:hypothetical protein
MYIFPKNRKSYYILFGCILIAGLFFWVIDENARYVAAPIIVASGGSILFFLRMTEFRKAFPLGDVGAISVLALLCYTIIPPIQYLLSDMTYAESNARQLFFLAPSAHEIGAFTWWYVLYLLSFLISYLLFLPNHEKLIKIPCLPENRFVLALLILFCVFSSFLMIVSSSLGLETAPTYGSESMYIAYEALSSLPLILRQAYGLIVSNGMILIVQISLLLVLFLRWKNKVYRYILFLWLFLLLITNILFMGNRTTFILIFMASILMYNQFVKPLNLIKALALALFLLCIFFMIGIMRGGIDLAENLQNLKTNSVSANLSFNQANEFQVLFGGNYDLLWMKEAGRLQDAPTQLICYDLVMLVPQQFLPFEKINVQTWYLNQSTCPSYFMFNPISQAIIGFGWVELVLRGCLLGFMLAKLRGWYVKHSASFWVTLFYFYITIISYYAIRGTAIYVLLASTLYRFIPLYVLVWVMTGCRRRVSAHCTVALPSVSN